MKLLAKNKRASYDYELTEKLVAGLVLTGAEVKSIKAGHASLKGSFIALRNSEAWLTNCHVTPYGPSAGQAFEPTRSRKLLLHRRQLDQLQTSRQGGLVPVPTALLQDKALVKLEIALGKGKKRYDKREAIKRREQTREAARQVKG